jgi:hypothetical protein
VTLARVLGGAAFWLRLRLWTTAPAHLMAALGTDGNQVYHKAMRKLMLLFGMVVMVAVSSCMSNANFTSVDDIFEVTIIPTNIPMTSSAFPTNTRAFIPQPSVTPSLTREPKLSSVIEPLSIESHTWEALPVLVQFRPKVCVDVCYGETFSALPSLILYSDGLMIIDRQVGTEFQLQAVQMSSSEVCALLNTIDLFGFLDYDPSDYVQKNQEFPRMQPSNNIEINAWKSIEFDPGGLDDFMEGGIFEGEIEVDLPLLRTYQLLFEYSRQNLDPYIPRQIIVSVGKTDQIDVLFDSGVWPLENISLKELFDRGISTSNDLENTTRLILENSEALMLFELFGQISAPSMRIYREDEQAYAISIRALLPYESMLSVSQAYGRADVIPGPDVNYETSEITCSFEDGVVDSYYSILENKK